MKRDYKNPEAYTQYRKIIDGLGNFPFSFTYDGVEYNGFCSDDLVLLSKNTHKEINKETTTVCLRIDKIVDITLQCSFYENHGVTEWTIWFENISNQNSKVLEKLESRVMFAGENPVLKGIYGDHEKFYEPYCFDLSKGNVHFQSDSGRATHINFPYFNIEYGTGGAMLAIGWAGTWTADFAKIDNGIMYTAKSVNNICTYLKPGEKIRTALFVIAPYTVRDEHYATNYWRSWYVESNMPKADKEGNNIEPFSTVGFSNDTGYPNSDGSISERYTTWRPSFEKMLSEGIKPDFRWFDAGWYHTPYLGSAESHVPGKEWWATVGTWELDPVKWPDKTFLESTEFAREHGMKTLMWFEPERVSYIDDLVKNFGYQKEWAMILEDEPVTINNIGNKECLEWTTDRICKTLRDNKVEMYREDCNWDPIRFWNAQDIKEGELRKGITESKFIISHYKMWDDIIQCTLSFDGCGFVDSCASGGGRNDLESMRRGVPLLRSDDDRTSTGLRLSMTTAFNKWIPFCGASSLEQTEQLATTGKRDKYVWRASYLATVSAAAQFTQDPELDFEMIRFGLNEWKKVTPYLLKEFYVLTPWHSQRDISSFTAFSYFDPEQEEGVLLAFRQEKCRESVLKIDLPYVSEDKICIITDEDTKERYKISYEELKNGEFNLVFDTPRMAKLLWLKLEDKCYK